MSQEPLRMSLAATDDPTWLSARALLESLDDDETVTLEWSNATLRASAGTIRAWLELGDMDRMVPS